jgi:peptide/nickel transport system ATP-binding protein
LLLRVQDLHVTYRTIYGPLEALNGVSFEMEEQESVALVGESGSGKSTLGLSIVKLLPPNASYTGGSIRMAEREVTSMSQREAVSIRGSEVFMIFQDPLNSLNPVKRVEAQLLEALRTRYSREGKHFDEEEARKEAKERLIDVRLPDPEVIMERYPHQLSGGQIQRVVIAMGLLFRPKLLIADEPTSALDVTIQAQVLKLMNELKQERRMSILFITHDISVAYAIGDRFFVMYAGEVSELGPAERVVGDPKHPYTKALIASIPRKSRKEGEMVVIPGSPPNMLDPPPGCRFHPRCPYVMEKCRTESPPERVVDERLLRCWLYE